MSRSTVPCPVTSPVGRTIAYPPRRSTRGAGLRRPRERALTRRKRPGARSETSTPPRRGRAAGSPVIHESGSNAASHSSALIRAMSEGPNSSKSYSSSTRSRSAARSSASSGASPLLSWDASPRGFAAVGLVRRPVRRRLRIRFGRGVLHCPPVRAPDANCFRLPTGRWGRPGRSAPESHRGAADRGVLRAGDPIAGNGRRVGYRGGGRAVGDCELPVPAVRGMDYDRHRDRDVDRSHAAPAIYRRRAGTYDRPDRRVDDSAALRPPVRARRDPRVSGRQAYALLAFALTGIARILQAKHNADAYEDPDVDIDEIHEDMGHWRARLRAGVAGFMLLWAVRVGDRALPALRPPRRADVLTGVALPRARERRRPRNAASTAPTDRFNPVFAVVPVSWQSLSICSGPSSTSSTRPTPRRSSPANWSRAASRYRTTGTSRTASDTWTPRRARRSRSPLMWRTRSTPAASRPPTTSSGTPSSRRSTPT